MNNFKFGIFDILVYTIPGAVLLFAFFLTGQQLASGIGGVMNNLLTATEKIGLNAALVIILICYILGFVLHYFGYNYFGLVAKRLWKKRMTGLDDTSFNKEHKYVLARHYSKENFVYVEMWNSFRGMSFNLSLAFLLIFLLLIFKMMTESGFSAEWAFAGAGSLVAAFVTLRRAVVFNTWSHNTLEETVKVLGLLERKDLREG